jgi:hypothetical protein
MKKIALFLSALVVWMSAGLAASAVSSQQVMVGVSDAFIPSGFDTESDVFVVISGIFPNTCYTWQGAQVSRLESHLHEVRSFANVQQGICLQVLVPFQREVRLGRLAEGQHRVRFLSGDGTYLEKSFEIR